MNTPYRDPGGWERDYLQRGRLWGGASCDLPAIPPGSRVLELGCGNGKTYIPLSERGVSVVGLDISPAAICLCQRASGEGAPLLVADARSLPFRDGSFDAVCAFHVAGHLKATGRNAIAGEIVRVLKEEGRLYFRDFSDRDMRYGKGTEVEVGTFLRGEGILTHYFSESEVRTLFSALHPHTLETCTWSLRVRGRDLPRAEVVAIFENDG
ncbi:class I SAM-dependent methyltransferase [uncultured Methanofollis sp.]|uniref:class I SAM-dependent methyltransferase n=1 Tax=uncultured Methanofollis sp. TaxID=262500 RepID=UPI00260F8621|nr:class I SAM-dependent methyltransferase [uncultured Methanofollis sp.]